MVAPTKVDPALFEYATARQAQVLKAIQSEGSCQAAASALGVDRSYPAKIVAALEKKAALKGYSPRHDMTHPVPDGFAVRGVSTYYDEEGKVRGQWVKSSADEERRWELLKEAVEALSQDVKGLAPLTPIPAQSCADLLTVIPMGDPHFGMYAWAQEAGENFDTDVARKLTLAAVDRLLSVAPASETCVILPLGDIFHANDQTNQTPAHKHQLDTDSRFVRVLQITVQTFRHAIQRALEKHPKVIVRFVRGNHDPEAVWALAVAISAFFDSEPRVTIDLSPADHWFLRFGKVLIGATHGDRSKPESLMGIMACDRPQDWGETAYRYFYTGHIHSSNKKEFPGMVWESFRTLAAKDAYAAGHGYRAGRDMLAIVHHKEHGEIERHRCDVGMIA